MGIGRAIITSSTVALLTGATPLAAVAANVLGEVTLCVPDPASDEAALHGLAQFLPDVKVALRTAQRCPRALKHGQHSGWFVVRGRAARFVLAGLRSVQAAEVPWLRQIDAPLARLAAAGKLSEFSIILRGLLTPQPPSMMRAQPRSPAPPAVEVIRRDPASLATSLPPASRPRPVARPQPVSRPQPAARPQPVARAQPGARRSDPDAAVSTIRRPARLEPTRSLLADFALEVQLGGMGREIGTFAFELSGALSWRWLFLRAGYQLADEWRLQGRPMEASAVTLAAGWRQTIWRKKRWSASVSGALVAERVAVRRLEMEQAVGSHAFWDLGIAPGTGLDCRLARHLRGGLVAELVWFPRGQDVTVPDGPSARFNRLGGRFAAMLAWTGATAP